MFEPSVLKLDESEKPGYWLTGEDILYTSPRGPVIRIPKGTETDLASIPRIFRPFFRKAGRHRKPAVLHDYLYSRQSRIAYPKIDREWADQEFYLSMVACNVNRFKAALFFAGVRLGGWLRYRK